MTKNEIIDAIYSVLANEINISNIAAFHPKAKLNEDLYLDSVLVLQLLITLELKLGVAIPDEALNADDFDSVDSLSIFLLGKLNKAEPSSQQIMATETIDLSDEISEEFEDIKVHCFVSCLCEAIKADERVDHRPFYFGVWDAEVVVDSNYHINYHAEALNHDFFRFWYQKLYGVKVNAWYQNEQTKKVNIANLLNLLDKKSESQHLMVMLDLFRLPERENKFNQNPFPHYVILENSQDQDKLYMSDPDFRWEGEQDKKQVLNAIASQSVAGGYLFDSDEITPSSAQAIHDYFIECLNLDNNPMTNAVRLIIDTHLHNDNQLSPDSLSTALNQLPVLAIRKYAYEHGLAFFMLELGLDFDDIDNINNFEYWCDIIEILVSTYKHIQFRAMKIANNISDAQSPFSHQENNKLIAEITQLLDEQDQREFKIKQHINQLFNQWKLHIGLTNNKLCNEVFL